MGKSIITSLLVFETRLQQTHSKVLKLPFLLLFLFEVVPLSIKKRRKGGGGGERRKGGGKENAICFFGDSPFLHYSPPRRFLPPTVVFFLFGPPLLIPCCPVFSPFLVAACISLFFLFLLFFCFLCLFCFFIFLVFLFVVDMRRHRLCQSIKKKEFASLLLDTKCTATSRSSSIWSRSTSK